MKPGTPTSFDIAQAAGVSQATVSRALRGSSRVHPDTRERIIRIAREMNYFVNRNAASLRTQRSSTIALLLFDESTDNDSQINPFFLGMLGSITRASANLGYEVLVSFQQLSDDWHIQYEFSNRADGLILLGYGDYVSYRPKLEALTNANANYIIWGPIVEDHPGHSVGCDNFRGAYEAVTHLANIGRRNIAFVGQASNRSPEFHARLQGYQQALRQSNLREHPALRVDAANLEESGISAAESLLESGASFDGLFAASDQIAIGAMRALQTHGVRIPDDVSVVGFDDIPRAAAVTPALTTVQQNTRVAGELLVRNLVRLIDGEPITSTLMPPKLVVRRSCGAAIARPAG
jgi:DNA-binding LacI/PurR family transcriptional regulator